MLDVQDTQTKIIILIVVIGGIFIILRGLMGILHRKIRLKGNYRTPRYAIGKYAVINGLGISLYGIIFIFLDCRFNSQVQL
jgi:hypothetical protein